MEFLTGGSGATLIPYTHPAALVAGASQREIFESFPFHPFILTGWMSARLLPGYIGQVLAARTLYQEVDDGSLLAGLQLAN